MLTHVHRSILRLAVVLFLLAADPSLAVDGITETMLPNGLRVLTKEVHAAPVVTVQVWYRVGSRNEHTGITGASHLLEHMMFKGTKTYEKGEIRKLIREKGGIDNAGTWTDFTQYWSLMSSEHLDFALQLEADRMVNSLIDAQELQSEMVVVRSELEGRQNSPATLLWDEVSAAAFRAHPYQWPIIGWTSDVEGVSRDQVFNHYRTYYHPNNATLVIVGDFDTEHALTLVRKHYGTLPAGPEPPQVYTVEPPQYGERRVTVGRQGATDRVMIAYRAPAISHPDIFALSVADQVLSGGKSSRLYQAMVEKEVATQASSNYTPRTDPSLFTLTSVARAGVPARQLEEAMLDQVERIKSEPVSDDELQRAKNQIEAYFVFSNDSVTDQAEQIGYYSTIGDWKMIDEYLPNIQKVTREDVQRVANTYLIETNRTVGWFVPADEAAIDKAQTAYAEGSGLTPISSDSPAPPGATDHYAEPADVKAGSSAAPVRAEASTERVKPFRTVLPNGMVVIVQENHSNPTVAIRGNLKAGSVFDPAGKKGLASLTASMLNRGTVNRTSLQIAEATESVGASADVSSGVESASFSGSALTKDFRLIVDVLSDMLQRPSFPEEQLEKLRGETLSALEQERERPSTHAQRAFRNNVFPAGHPYHPQTIEQDVVDLKVITRQDVFDFHTDYYGPDTAVIVIVGDVDSESAVATVQEFFGNWHAKGTAPVLEIPSVPVRAKPITEVIPMMDKPQTNIIFGHAGMLSRKDPQFYAANVMNQILGGGGALSSRLGKTIRDEMGLVYDVHSMFNATLGEGPWYVSLGTNPKNVDKAVDELKSIIAKMRDEGATQDEVTEAIQFITGYFPIALETNGGVANVLLSAEFYGLGMDYIRDYQTIYKAVTLEQVNAAASKYLHPDRGTLVIAGPYKETQ